MTKQTPHMKPPTRKQRRKVTEEPPLERSVGQITGVLKPVLLARKLTLYSNQCSSKLQTCSIRIEVLYLICETSYSETCVREPPLSLTLNSGWYEKKRLSYKGPYHVILLAKLHDMYLYKTATIPHQPLKSISKVAFLHRFHYSETYIITITVMNTAKGSMAVWNQNECKPETGPPMGPTTEQQTT